MHFTSTFKNKVTLFQNKQLKICDSCILLSQSKICKNMKPVHIAQVSYFVLFTCCTPIKKNTTKFVQFDEQNNIFILSAL